MSLITPVATLSFPQLFTPKRVDPSDQSETPKYSASLIFDEDAQATDQYRELKAAAVKALQDKFGQDALEKVKSGKLTWPFLDGPSARAPEGTTVLRVRSTRQPGVVSIVPGPDGRPATITNQQEVYAGAQVRASLGVFSYDKPTNKGVSFGLNNIQKIADGERIDGKKDARDEFEADADMAADLSALDDAGETETVATGASLDDLL